MKGAALFKLQLFTVEAGVTASLTNIAIAGAMPGAVEESRFGHAHSDQRHPLRQLGRLRRMNFSITAR